MIEIEMANAVSVSVNNEVLTVNLDDGRILSIPTS